MPRVVLGGGRFLMSEVPLQGFELLCRIYWGPDANLAAGTEQGLGGGVQGSWCGVGSLEFNPGMCFILMKMEPYLFVVDGRMLI